jgi:DNA processing protein
MVMTPARSVHHYDTSTPPPQGEGIWLRDLVQASKRSGEPKDIRLFFVGDLALVSRRCVSIIGTREASPHGLARATRLARELVQHGTVIVSGLARGIDTAAHLSAIGNGGRTVAIIGTPLSKASPVENASLQETIWRHHLLISPFPEDRPVSPKNFPERNKVMAALSDATVIVEASNTSGTLHQASECRRLGRWLFIMRAVVENPAITWPKRFLNDKNTAVLDRTEQILDALSNQ